jgi:hypothetical protein
MGRPRGGGAPERTAASEGDNRWTRRVGYGVVVLLRPIFVLVRPIGTAVRPAGKGRFARSRASRLATHAGHQDPIPPCDRAAYVHRPRPVRRRMTLHELTIQPTKSVIR